MKDRLPKDILNFVIKHIDSVELLEVLVVLHARAGTELTVDAVDSVIRSNSASVLSRLEHLAKLGLAVRSDATSPTFTYRPTTPELERLGGELVRIYQARRTEVIELIYSKPMKEILTFAEAFRLRGDKE